MHLLKTVGLFGLALSSALSSASAEDDWKTDLTGLYVGGGVGLTKGIETTASGTSGGKVDFNNGAALTVFVGKQLSGNLRGEAELTGRRMDLSSMAGSSANGSAKTTGAMGNIVYDINAGLAVNPYFGAGAGFTRLSLDNASPFGASTIDDSDTVGAFQAMAGASYQIRDNIDLFADYRYFATTDGDFTTAAGDATSFNFKAHSVMAGLRFSFGAPNGRETQTANNAQNLADGTGDRRADQGQNDTETAAPPMSQTTLKTSMPDHTLPDTYMVHFKLNSAEVLPEAIAIIENVASNARAQDLTRLILSGHTDTSGPEAFNVDLSRKRAESVRTAFIALGFMEDEVTIKALGETQPLVPTGDNVFEPKNRRVEIVLPQ